MINYGKIFRVIRENSKNTQEVFSKTIGISRSSLAQIEINKAKPTLEILEKVIKSYKINPSVFFLPNQQLYSDKRQNLFEINSTLNKVNYKKDSLNKLFYNYMELTADTNKNQLTSNDVRNIKELLNNL